MSLTTDESRALAFIAGLLLVSAAVRVASIAETGVPEGAGLDVAAHVDATRAAVTRAERAALPLAAGERIDPNAADAVELDRLPRVGPALAMRIVEDREEHGPFRAAGDLLRVPGVGPRVLEGITPHLTLPAVGAAAGGSRARAGPREGAPAGASADRGMRAAEVLDINRADAETLATLPGIGPVLAARIVAHRDSAGPFAAVDSLVAVSGVGPATLERLRARVRAGVP